jgi:2-C-methyl-D-erythritol 4-phosphate cytidylyltransferase / 2-C-methyl-D-erythritol 2,4-cyclodiphosphate synthase
MNTALIVAAGTSSRAQTNQSKVLYKIAGKPIFMHSVDRFLSMGHKIILVVSKGDYKLFESYIKDHIKLVIGGETRSESVMLGLKEVQTPYVFIHDAARPLIHEEIILEVEKALEYHDAVLVCEKVTSALKKIEGSQIKSINRDEYLLAQTPQAFLTEKIRYAHIRNSKAFDDDIALYQSFYPEDKVHVVINQKPNIKVTYPQDFNYVKSHLEGESNMRIGHSFDIHQLVADKPLYLGGILIPHEKGLLGHSDADCLLHAICEAMLGALALGDLGTHFPDTDMKYKGIASSNLLKEVYQMIRHKGYEIGNIDAMVYAQEPKLTPYKESMQKNIASLLEIHLDQISIKATTYEKMDAIGEGLAIASEVVVMLRKVSHDY